jgi:hypothetical protein
MLLFCIFVLDLLAQDPATYRGYRFALVFGSGCSLFFCVLSLLTIPVYNDHHLH